MDIKFAFSGEVRFPLIAEVGGHRTENPARVLYWHTPDGLYFDPKSKTVVRGSERTMSRLEVLTEDEGWEFCSYAVLEEPNTGMEFGPINEYIRELIIADVKRQEEKARAAHELEMAEHSPKH